MAHLGTCEDRPGLWRLKVALATVIFCLSVSAVPIYNKLIFDRGVCADAWKFPYPVATASLQLAVVALVLGLWSCLRHASSRDSSCVASWIGGPHLRYKLKHCAPVGILFGLKYGVTNWGLQLVPTGTHLLLQSTDVLWTILLAKFANREDLGLTEALAALLSASGSALIGCHAAAALEAPFLPLLVNLLPPFLLALCVSTLRMGAKELFRPENRLGGSMTPAEFTAIKLALSALTAMALAMVCENATAHKAAWWTALSEESAEGVAVMLLGGVFVLIFQVNLTWLASLTSVATVGILGGLKVLPQWMLNALFQLKVDLSPLNLLGAFLVSASAVLYASSSMMRAPSPCWKKRCYLEEKLIAPDVKSEVFFATGVLLDSGPQWRP